MMFRSIIIHCWLLTCFVAKITKCQSSSRCQQETLKMCKCFENSHQFVVDCTNAGLKYFPEGIPPKTTHLYLDHNYLKIVHKNTFMKRDNRLKVLSIKYNKLMIVEIGAFNNLKYLQELNLYNNSLELKTSLPSSVFSPVRNSLKVLDIRMNLKSENLDLVNYPVSVAELHNMVELKMDCLQGKSLPQVYKKLVNLQKLTFMNGRGNVLAVNDNLFHSVSKLNISEINLAGLNILKMGKKTFSKLGTLEILDISNNPRLVSQMDNLASSLLHTPIKVLRLNNTGLGDYSSITPLLKKFCRLDLRELTLDGNYIHVIDPIFSQCFPNIEIFSLAYNNIYLYTTLLHDILKLKNLIGLDISHQGRYRALPSMPTTNTRKRKTREVTICEIKMACPLSLPPKLQWIDASNNEYHTSDFPEMALMRNSTLKFVNASHSEIQTFLRPIYCPYYVCPNIETIDLSNNNLKCFATSFFNKTVTGCNWRSVKYLYLQNNKLGHFEENPCTNPKNNTLRFLKSLPNLRILDISNNYFLSDEKLTDVQTLSKLYTLGLASNGFNNFSLKLINMTKLVKLNLANNNLQCLSKSTIHQLDHLQQINNFTGGLTVDMSGNPFSCSCDCIHFFKWLARTDVSFVNIRSYQCVFHNDEKIDLNRLSYVIIKLESQCYGTEWFQINIGAVGTAYFLILLFTMMYRLRHYIWFFFAKMRLKRQMLRPILNKRKYTFNAFVSCEHRDAKWFVKRRLLPILETEETKLKFCVAQRDFIVGVTIIDNIIKAMNTSRKIIFIISEYFLESNWCKEELRIAQQVCYVFVLYYLSFC